MRLSDLREMGWGPELTVECVACGQPVHKLWAVEGIDESFACPPCALWHNG